MSQLEKLARFDSGTCLNLSAFSLQADPADVSALINYGCLLEEARRDGAAAEQLFAAARAIDPDAAQRHLEQRERPEPRLAELSSE